MATYDHQAIKFKLSTIVRDKKLSVIINEYVLKENKIIFEGMNLLNNYILNPAVAGSKTCLDIRFGTRRQWAGVTSRCQ